MHFAARSAGPSAFPATHSAAWVQYLSKFIELSDSLFMLLRGSVRQLSFLHVYHHASVIFPVWSLGIVAHNPGGSAFLAVGLNSLVHVFMYSAYAAASVRLQVFWRKFVTQFQILQFAVYMVQAFFLLHDHGETFKPMISTYLLASQSALYLYLFTRFYLSRYAAGKAAAAAAAADKQKQA